MLSCDNASIPQTVFTIPPVPSYTLRTVFVMPKPREVVGVRTAIHGSCKCGSRECFMQEWFQPLMRVVHGVTDYAKSNRACTVTLPSQPSPKRAACRIP